MHVSDLSYVYIASYYYTCQKAQKLCDVFMAILHDIVGSPPLLEVQGLCSVVVWYSPEVSCDEALEITGYEVQLYHPQLAHPNITSRVGANGTFYIVEKEKLLANNMTETYVQVSLIPTLHN